MYNTLSIDIAHEGCIGPLEEALALFMRPMTPSSQSICLPQGAICPLGLREGAIGSLAGSNGLVQGAEYFLLFTVFFIAMTLATITYSMMRYSTVQ